MTAKLKTIFFEVRPQFLILSVVLVFLGTTVAWHDGYFNFRFALLAAFGLVMAHASVNSLNDYFDFKSGIDLATKRTPFSGGSGILPEGKLLPGEVLWIGISTLLVAAAVGIYFIIVSGWQLLPLLLIGCFCIILYSPFILKKHWPEWSPGVGLGILPIMGSYFVQSSAYSWPVFIASVPSGILVHNLLFLNEFPDIEADKKGNRKTMPITIGRKNASKLYSALTICVYIWIIMCVITRIMPVYALLSLLTIPLALKAIKGALNCRDTKQLVPAMGNNVMLVMLIQFFLAIGFILDKAI